MASPAAAEAPLCKGSWRRRRLRGCFVEHSETIPPSRHTPCHLPLHKGGERTPPHLRLWGKLANVGSIGGFSAPPATADYSRRASHRIAGGFDYKVLGESVYIVISAEKCIRGRFGGMVGAVAQRGHCENCGHFIVAQFKIEYLGVCFDKVVNGLFHSIRPPTFQRFSHATKRVVSRQCQSGGSTRRHHARRHATTSPRPRVGLPYSPPLSAHRRPTD